MCPVCEALLHISKGDKREFRKRAEEEKVGFILTLTNDYLIVDAGET